MRLTPFQYGIIFINLLYRLYCGFFMFIADCDETFNYWEPLNLLLRGFGKQTWEYSPIYSIRSYAYLIPYYFIGKISQLIGLNHVQTFYFIRIVGCLGFTIFSEVQLFFNLNEIDSYVSNWWLFINSIMPGLTHSSVALLPSSLAMQTTILANSYILKSFKKDKSRSLLLAVFWYFIGGILGWPFALSLGFPIGMYIMAEVFQNTISVNFLFKIASLLTLIITVIVGVDSYFLQKLVFVPINIVSYNVFGGEGEGPEIFGIEPFSYYVQNLILNFHIIFPISVIGVIVNPFITKYKLFNVLLSSQLIIWGGIFSSQPHKEERFLYPIYGLITLSSSIIISKIFKMIKNINKRFYYYVITMFIMGLILISNLRIYNLVENYSAPLGTFQKVSELPTTSEVRNVCMGKEWYHFPNSFFLPDNYRLQFVDSGFDGLLPGNFKESVNIIDSTTHIPDNMNNKNQFEVDKVIALQDCDYFIDNSQSNSVPQLIYPNLETRSDWSILQCNRILNPNGSHNLIGKLIYIPLWLRKIIPYKVEYMEFCLLERIKKMIENV